jgi:hypothetical protein
MIGNQFIRILFFDLAPVIAKTTNLIKRQFLACCEKSFCNQNQF